MRDKRNKQTRGNRFEKKSKGFRDRDKDKFSKPRQRLEFHRIVCDKCNKSCEVPFKPTSGKPIYCDECFKETKNHGSGNDKLNEKLDQINKKLDKILNALDE